MLYNIVSDYMKKVFIPIIFLISLAIILFVVFTNAEANRLSNIEALEIGEEKYLEFLWMVDGAFNSEREKGDFNVNNKTLSNDKKVFLCKYEIKKSKECVGYNFKEEFNNLFSNNLNYDDVYSDGLMYSWYRYHNGKYLFKNLDNCSINRMSLNQNIEVKDISSNELVYKVTFKNNQTDNIKEKDFVLVLEDGKWKVKTAFYHDMCGVKYYIY